jgi:NTE family protein
MDQPSSYEEWRAWAVAEDRRTGAAAWRDEERSSQYDYKVIRHRHDEIVEIRKSADLQRLLYYLNEGLHGNMGGMGAPSLYARSLTGTKTLITNYVAELVGALSDLEEADENEIAFTEKLAYFRRARDCFGRSAFHIGVAKALAEQDLVPNVISGASAGSIVAAVLGTHPTDEIAQILSPESAAIRFQALRDPREDSPRRKRLQLEHVRELIETAIPDMTFIEAFEETGRSINVSVAPSMLHQRSRLLNASTSPNAFIREAVLASCAIPGIFPPVTLAARGPSGERLPYVPSRQWVDGSITDDLPARRLSRLYGVNHFITSQANPISLFAVRDPHAAEGLMSRFAGIYWSASRDMVRTLYPFAMSMVRNIHPINTYTRFLFSVMTQNYNADINIILAHRFIDPRLVLARLSPEEAEGLALAGERATWPKVEMIRNCTAVSRFIEAALARLRERSTRADEALFSVAGRA